MSNKLFMKNVAPTAADLYVYGQIVDEKWWDTDVNAKDLRDAIDGLNEGSILNLYVNSPGGSVFVASAMTAMINRCKERGVCVNAYVDGVAASAASFLIMAADNIVMYKNSMLMIHKPMSMAFGNADELQKTIDALNKIEESVMMPLYEQKAIGDMETIKDMIDAETWLSAEETAQYFDVTISDNEAQIAALVDRDVLKNYKNVPTALVEGLTAEPIEDPEEEREPIDESVPEPEPVPDPIDYSGYETRIENLRKEI